MEAIPCRFHPRCSSVATAIYHIPAGCICWPDPVQALCEQHATKAESLGPITLVHSLAPFTEVR